jgi:uncharacterized protein
MAKVYSAALKKVPQAEQANLKAEQRGWIKGRNDCWKDGDLRSCVEEQYRTRIVELQIMSGQLVAPEPVGYACGGSTAKPFFAAFYGDTEPKSVVLTYEDDQVIAFIAPSGSGAKYVASGVEFWEHHGEASVDWFGTQLKCKVIK